MDTINTTPSGIPYTVRPQSLFTGIQRDRYPQIKAEVIDVTPAFIEMVRRVANTGVPEYMDNARLNIGGKEMGSGPAVMYRDDNPTSPTKK